MFSNLVDLARDRNYSPTSVEAATAQATPADSLSLFVLDVTSAQTANFDTTSSMEVSFT